METGQSSDTVRAERVRFKRGQSRVLQNLPSHDGSKSGPVVPGKRPRWKTRPLRWLLASVVGLLLIVGAITAYLVNSGALEDRLRQEAQSTLIRLVPEPYEATVESTEVAFSWPPTFVVRYSGFEVAAPQTQTVVVKAQTLEVALDPVASIRANGRPVFSAIDIEDMTFDVQALPQAEPGIVPLPVALRDVPDIVTAVADGVGGLIDRLAAADDSGSQNDIAVSAQDIRIALPPNAYTDTINIVEASSIVSGSRLETTADLQIAGQTSGLSLRATRGAEATDMRVDLTQAVFPARRLRTFLSNNMDDHEPDASPEPVLVDLTIQARTARSDLARDALTATLTPRDLQLKLADGDFVPVNGTADLSFDFADNTITWARGVWTMGNSNAIVSARLRDVSADEEAVAFTGPIAPIEFEGLLNQGRIVPSDSPERPLSFASRVQGTMVLGEGRFDFANMELDTSEGYARAEGVVTARSDPPIAIFDVETNDMSVAGLKQLWPGTVAREARVWVLNNLAGGRVTEGRFAVAEPLRRRIPGSEQRLFGDTRISLGVEGVRFDVTGDLPPVRDALGTLTFEDQVTRIELETGTVFLASGREAEARNGTLIIQPPDDRGLVMATADVSVSGDAQAIGELIQLRPIEAQRYRAFDPGDLSGAVDADIEIDFALNAPSFADAPAPDWSVDLTIADAGSEEPVEGRLLAGLDGAINVTPRRAIIDVDGDMDGLPADIELTIPFAGSGVEPSRRVVLNLDDAQRQRIAPGLDVMLTGSTPVVVGGVDEQVEIAAELKSATLSLPWIGWSKGKGIPASVAFDLVDRENRTVLDDFNLQGDGFGAAGRIEVSASGLARANMNRVWLNPGDDFSVNIEAKGDGYDVAVEGRGADLRALMRHVRKQLQASGAAEGNVPVNIDARLAQVAGFNGETMRDVRATARIVNAGLRSFSVTGVGGSGMPFSVVVDGLPPERRVRVEAFDAGEFLRFLDVYNQVQGGALGMTLGPGPSNTLAGPLELRNFRIFNEPALERLVSTRRDERGSLREALDRDIDLREVAFDIGTADMSFGAGTLDVAEAYIRGPLVGFALQGRVFDRNNRTRMTGTFLPAYGLNSAFAEIPLLGLLLGNGRDRGLIGVTFLLEGDFDAPKVTVNPLSVIAPGIFRNIFQFR